MTRIKHCTLLILILLTGVRAYGGEAGLSDEIAALKAEVRELGRLLDEQRQAHGRQLEAMQKKLDELSKAQAAAKPPPKEEFDSVIEELRGEEPVPKISAFSRSLDRPFQSFNPDISVIGDFVGRYVDSEKRERMPDGSRENEDRFQMREVEMAFSSPVDPFGRADIFVHTHEHDGEWHTGLCEGYMTLLTLPHDTQARIGKFRSAFGKANGQRVWQVAGRDSADWIVMDFVDVVVHLFVQELRTYYDLELLWGEAPLIDWR